MRKQTNNKALYESIMRKVSRVVKQSLNEKREREEFYTITYIDVHCEQDDYEEGVTIDAKKYSYDINVPNTKFTSLSNLVDHVVNKILYCDDCPDLTMFAWEDDEILIQYMCDSDNDALSAERMNMWKKGKIDAYIANVHIGIANSKYEMEPEDMVKEDPRLELYC